MESATVTAALVAVIMGLMKLVEWLMKKYGKNGNGHVKLDPDQGRQLREVHEKFILVERDIGELKMVNGKVADAMKDIADCLKKVSETNEKVATLVEKIDRRQEIEEEIQRRKVASSG